MDMPAKLDIGEDNKAVLNGVDLLQRPNADSTPAQMQHHWVFKRKGSSDWYGTTAMT